MKKIYQAPELEVYFIEEFCQTMNEGQSEQGGEVTPTANDNNTFDENDIVKDVTTPTTLWDD